MRTQAQRDWIEAFVRMDRRPLFWTEELPADKWDELLLDRRLPTAEAKLIGMLEGMREGS
jgi:hypothetical protein